ncbi:MAG: sigma-70 family RNA polymerase sigma factor [Dehalococcoidia bacterium]|nr:sigma-70 family RNA polymerase sigma factor [Dehalococcoidia bacterium]
MDDIELVRASQSGDLDSFNELVRRHQKMAYNVAFRMLGDSQSAEDVTQDAFFSAWRNIGGFRGGSFKAWVLQITANACRDQLRRAKRRPVVPLESLPYDPPSMSSESPEDYAVRREMADHVQRGLITLSRDQRMTVILCDIQGLSYEEVAEVMRCSLGTVKSRLNRGRTRLRDYFLRMELISTEMRHNK